MTFPTTVFLRGKISKRYRVHYAVYRRNSFAGEAAAQTKPSNSDDTVSTLKKVHKGFLYFKTIILSRFGTHIAFL
jgi:hypothetical protein